MLRAILYEFQLLSVRVHAGGALIFVSVLIAAKLYKSTTDPSLICTLEVV